MTAPRRNILGLILAGAAFVGVPDHASAETVTVFAAASLKPALDEIAKTYEAESGQQINLSYAGSSALARQIQHGAPAQLFLSANTAWMDALEADGLIAEDSRHNLITNRLALISSVDNPVSLALEPGAPLSEALGDGRLAIALVRAVPAGIYGRQALEHLGLWAEVQTRLAQTDNVTAALRLVGIGEAPMGVVYVTDAAASDWVRLVGLFPQESHTPIVYPVALMREGDTSEARAFLDHLSSQQADSVFQAHGFGLAEDAP
ncbi:molybdate ABC transporter substrate-binding protein [Falsiruegeria mediterranea]|jgi:molybdate transport system substrate-binding protein|uniref:Molybdate-binding protein ModA n=1 Tax=Falsiruegeria mediterranea M17 TaxID=1200281 RepID=A0A2R8C7S4_9RHOB|nr:molybdate ABC transporter substrate-binding protein [Falsiruegeria mediterranea]SPJ28489.1 Molybdate-binding periplasmic protein [Falsiruegeria mediterranea M17]